MDSHKLRKTLKPILLPFSFIYGISVAIRNGLFDWEFLKSVEFNFPLISVGNITAGGTGKTPHVEYLLKLLSKNYSMGILSRGYKRKTKGFLLASENSLPQDVGDESYQIYKKFRNVMVAVDVDRVHGIELMKEKNPGLEAVILDDAFQHRYVKAGISIVLIDYYRPIYNDCILPAGDLRENKSSIRRANVVIVTKVPEGFKPIEKRLWMKELNLFPYQDLYFTRFDYGNLIPVFPGTQKKILFEDFKNKSASVLLITGIANPKPLVEKVKKYAQELVVMIFSDHHEYKISSFDSIHKKFDTLKNSNKIIITTEKDAVKLSQFVKLNSVLKKSLYFMPVEVKFLYDGHKSFDKKIIKYVTENKKHS